METLLTAASHTRAIGPNVPCSKGWHTEGSLGVRRRTVKIAQTVHPRAKVKDVLAELHEGPSEGHLGVNKTLGKAIQRYYWPQARNDV
jgi:hypothetical protein